MKIKIDLKTIFGNVIFSLEKENNTILQTLLEAIKTKTDLRGANLCEANLCGANLREAALCEANLREADLRGANLREANLRGANLRGANLREADLCEANLREADLRGANLRGANLREADLCEANLRGADLRGANLCEANLRGADLKKQAQLNSILPEGELIVWKKLNNNLIAKLLIPKKAKRVNAIGSRKCRFSEAFVIAIYDGKKKVNTGYGTSNYNFVYTVGETVYPDKFDPSPLIECSNGIHAFITKLEAQNY
jgi:hypothetical protein